MDLSFSAAPRQPGPGQPITLGWKRPSGLYGLSVINFLLRIVTLGIYGFWAKTEVRKRIWSAVRIEGEPLQYTGTGAELFLGFLFVFFLVLTPLFGSVFAVTIAFGRESVIPNVYIVVVYTLMVFLIGVAVYRATRYRLARTRWRSIRGSLEGSAAGYGWTYFWTLIVAVLTVGWATPWRETKLQGILTRDMRFGTEPFRFDAASGPLYPRFAVLWIAAILIYAAAGVGIAHVLGFLGTTPVPIGAEGSPYQIGPDGKMMPTLRTLGLIYGVVLLAGLVLSVFYTWFLALQARHFAKHTHFDGASFKSTVSTAGLIWISLSNILIVLGTLGILTPIAQARAARYMIENLEAVGTVRLGEIMQGAEQNIRAGEGLAQAFDIDAF